MEIYRYFALESYDGKTVEISLENGAIYRGTLHRSYNNETWGIDGFEGKTKTTTIFNEADIRSLTCFP